MMEYWNQVVFVMGYILYTWAPPSHSGISDDWKIYHRLLILFKNISKEIGTKITSVCEAWLLKLVPTDTNL